MDFALMRLDSGVRSSSRMCLFGGPSRINASLSVEPTTAQIYGQGNEYRRVDGGQGYEDVLPQGLNNPNVVNGARTSQMRNAGAPVLSGDGLQALGIMGQAYTHAGAILATDALPRENPYGSEIFRLGPILQRLNERLHDRFTLLPGTVQ